MEFHQIRYFLMAAENLNFTRAAEKCHVSQPALTRAIHKLEEELGGDLFIRDGRAVTLSALGGLMREHFRRIHATQAMARAAAKSFLDEGSAARRRLSRRIGRRTRRRRCRHAGGYVQQNPATVGPAASRATGQSGIPEQEKYQHENRSADRTEEASAGDRKFAAHVDPRGESPGAGHQN